jgi:hypothetical protein
MMVQYLRRQPVRITANAAELAQRYRNGASLDDLAVLCGCNR